MKQYIVYIIIYFVLINLAGFALMGIDKNKARKGKWRIPEKNIFFMALIGGAFGATLGMKAFRHKTKHWYFKYGLPAIFVVQILLIIYLYIKVVL